MIYVAYVSSDEDGNAVLLGVFEGPDGLIIDKLLADFNKRWQVKFPKYPEYTGPTIPTQTFARTGVSACSGSMPDGWTGRQWDTDSPEYKRWDKEKKRLIKEWQEKTAENTKKCQEMYPGKAGNEMFLSYLEKEHNLKKIPFYPIQL